MRILQVAAPVSALLVSACTTLSATQPYHHPAGEDMVISAVMPSGKLKIFINGTLVIENTILNFGEQFIGQYNGRPVTAVCVHRKHVFSVENECNVFIDNKPAVNLVLK